MSSQRRVPPSQPRNLADLVTSAAAGRGEHPAVVCGERTVPWRDVDASVSRWAAAFAAAGLAPGDRVGLALGNSVEFVESYFGALRAGLVAVPVNGGFTRPELAHVLGDSGARAAVCTVTLAADIRAAAPGLDPLVVSGDDAPTGAVAAAGFLDVDAPAPDTGRGGEDLAVLLYTSGTSGRPRGAMLSHRALLANLDQLARIDPPVVTGDDVVLVVLPLFHVYGLNAGLGLATRAGATVVLSDRFDPVATLAEITRNGVTNVVGAPPMYVAWSMLPGLGEAFSGVRLASSGAAPLPPEVLATMAGVTGRPVWEGYGLTETAPVLTSTIVGGVAKPGSVGRPIPGVDLRLVDDAGGEPEEGDAGEIVVRGANLFSGYWPDGREGPDPDGWFATGDLAYADEDGDLHLVGRRRELILVSGFNVYPSEVEEVLAAHPGVLEVAVVGVPHPYTGETVKALVVADPQHPVTAEDLIDHAAGSLARFKCPTSIEFVPDLPRSATGKLARGRLEPGPSGGAR